MHSMAVSVLTPLTTGAEYVDTTLAGADLERQRQLWAKYGKRVSDVLLAVLLMALAGPLFLAIAAAVWLSDPGPIFFRQARIGRSGEHFGVLKFRTMVRDAEARLRANEQLYAEYVENGFKLTTTRDPRLTGLGAFLRRTSLDELPQLLNVLLGDMSLVGPRPVVPDEIRLYGTLADRVLSVRPGMTGLWQVSGRNDVAYPDRVLMDCEYVAAQSPHMDLRILLKTPAAVLRRQGVA
jgi:exopolysaccharide production protein ExoY